MTYFSIGRKKKTIRKKVKCKIQFLESRQTNTPTPARAVLCFFLVFVPLHTP